jgi:adenosylcobinamide-GDP ribazoletransferase
VRGARLAVAFLTIVPVRLSGDVPPLGKAAGWFALVGALIGAAAGGAGYLLRPTFGPTVAALLSVLVLVVLTGALHQDGLADCADGLGVRGDRERRLTVMRDSAIGTFGGLALTLWLLLALTVLAGLSREDAFKALVVAASTARAAALLHSRAVAPARSDGLGADFNVETPALLAGAASAGAISLVVLGPAHGVLAVAVAGAVALLTAAWARATLGGRTGDTIGATVAVAEAAVLLAVLAVA